MSQLRSSCLFLGLWEMMCLRFERLITHLSLGRRSALGGISQGSGTAFLSFLKLIHWLILDKWFNISVPQFTHL